MKDKQTGEPNGMFVDGAQRLVGARGSPRGPDDTAQEILLGVKRSIELGWCQIQNAGSSFSEVALLKKLYGEGKIKLRIYEAIRGPGSDAQRLLTEGAMIGAFDNRLTVRHIKVTSMGAWIQRRGASRALFRLRYKGLLTRRRRDAAMLSKRFERASS